MLNRNEDTIMFLATIGGSDYEMEIAFTISDYCLNVTDEPARGVEAWRVFKIDGRPNMLGNFWAEQLDAESVCDAIMDEVE